MKRACYSNYLTPAPFQYLRKFGAIITEDHHLLF